MGGNYLLLVCVIHNLNTKKILCIKIYFYAKCVYNYYDSYLNRPRDDPQYDLLI